MAAPPSVIEGLDLETLVRAELREPVAVLVRRLVPELVAEQLNGHAVAATVAASLPERPADAPELDGGTTSTRETAGGEWHTCAACGEPKPPEAFTRGHTTCKPCRSARESERVRRRRAEAEAAEPSG